MKENRSLELSLKIKKVMGDSLLGPMSRYFPREEVERYQKERKYRDRIYTLSNTVQTMIVSASQEDKTLQQSVMIFKEILEKSTGEAFKRQEVAYEEEKSPKAIKRGRPKTRGYQIAKSKLKEISLSTSSYTTARQRVTQELMNHLFERSREATSRYGWKGREVFIADGTYVQLQDTSELKNKYSCRLKKEGEVYPQALIETVIHQGSGCIYAYKVANRQHSELDWIGDLIKTLPKKSVLLGDDLYNSYTVFCQALEQNIDLIVPGKRVRKYEVKKTLGPGDELVRIQVTKEARQRLEKEGHSSIPQWLILRRLEYANPNNGDRPYVLYTTLLDQSIEKTEIIACYLTRWDIEISIREIKTIMHMNVLRSKSEEMVFKEVAATFIAYNFIRKIILESVESTDFSPQKDLFYEFYTFGKTIYRDKKGRVYQRWSPGRYGNAQKTDSSLLPSLSPFSPFSKKD